MLDSLVDAVNGAMDSPWIYLALWGIALLDAFFPAVPSETLVITAGVYASAHGEPNIVLVGVLAAVGAFMGDHVSYGIGHLVGRKWFENAPEGSKRRNGFRWASKTLHQRGGAILLIARYIPGGRTAATLTMGASHYPLRSFTPFDALAAGSWGIYCVLLGFIGGHAFEDDPIKGLLLGLGIAVFVTVVIEVVRKVREKHKEGDGASAAPGTTDEAHDPAPRPS